MSETPRGASTSRFRRRRANQPGGRQHSHRVKVTPEEEAVLLQLALAQGVSVPRLLVEAATSRSGKSSTERRAVIAELLAVRRLLAAVSNNVNQLARHANSGEEFPEEAAMTLRAVRRLVPRIDAAADALARP
ncbi:MobC family plasmid mobilization relaxosome protein [Aquipuribacter hungaricus]|uniref:MobC family plasmid mobilization relaxosome protein n=1 Tax=Aquipuribacter hungaricus TaxID=545624 RepID=A0ABV7WGJ5_9MICO